MKLTDKDYKWLRDHGWRLPPPAHRPFYIDRLPPEYTLDTLRSIWGTGRSDPASSASPMEWRAMARDSVIRAMIDYDPTVIDLPPTMPPKGRYRTEFPCRAGHMSDRYESGGTCVMCRSRTIDARRVTVTVHPDDIAVLEQFAEALQVARGA